MDVGRAGTDFPIGNANDYSIRHKKNGKGYAVTYYLDKQPGGEAGSTEVTLDLWCGVEPQYQEAVVEDRKVGDKRIIKMWGYTLGEACGNWSLGPAPAPTDDVWVPALE